MMDVSDLLPRFLDAGDAGLVVEFGDVIDEAVNARVVALDAALAERSLPGVRETVPTYRSLLILFDPLELSR
ncbi:MAG TPA: carboxyltransferase domain-containing protein, partial [Methylomirabilota bacterium]|nr:carboxyltransferase domain-containing protein [Methylomirabilota bacterium]